MTWQIVFNSGIWAGQESLQSIGPYSGWCFGRPQPKGRWSFGHPTMYKTVRMSTKNIPNLSLPVLVAKFVEDKKNIASGFWAPCHTKPPSCTTVPWGWAKSITVLRYAWKTLKWEGGKCLKNHSKITWFRGGASKSSANLTNFCMVER